MELSETVGTREFSVKLETSGLLILKEGKHEMTRGTLCDALAALAERPELVNPDTTLEDMLRAFVRSYARVV